MHRILHVVGVRWWSAIAEYAVSLAGAQAARGDDVAIAALRDTPPVRVATERGIPVPITFARGVRGELALRRTLAPELARRRIQVLHVHTGAGHLAAESARARTETSLVRSRGEVRPARRTPVARWLHARADAVTVSGRFLVPSIARLGVPEARRFVVPAGVDVEHFAPASLPDRLAARRELRLPEDGFLAGVVGRLSPVKGHDVAIRALGESGEGVHLLIAGEEFQVTRRMLRELASHVGVEGRVHFLDRVPDVRVVLAALDVGLITSTGSEAICRIAAEMMACGRPVIASRVSVLPDMIAEGETGRLVTSGDPAALARAIEELAGDDALRGRMGSAARADACRRLSLDTQVETFAGIYESATSRRVHS